MANEEHLAILRHGVAVWNQWRIENPGIRPHFIGIDFSHANLSEINLDSARLAFANFSGANLSNAKLSFAYLVEANFNDANLSNAKLINADLGGGVLNNADLSNADLFGADLSEANLCGANLSNSDLSVTYFVETILNNANFTGVFLGNSVFANIDLSTVQGLETSQHSAPSTIGVDTIYKSKGQIPEIFLRGCGVPEIFIETLHNLAAKPLEFHYCYISHSPADEVFAQRLHDTLQSKGVRCYTMEKNAKLGVPISRNIEKGIGLTDKFLLCCSKESLGSGWVNFEIDLALHRETELRQETAGNPWRIIPLDLDGHLFSSEYSGEALRIRNRLAGDFTGWKTDSDKFDRQIARVMQAIRIEGGGK